QFFAAWRGKGAFRFNIILDGVLIPGTALATAIVCFYPGVADRWLMPPLWIGLVFFNWGLVVRWLRSRRQGGELLIAVRPPRPVLIFFGCVLGFLALASTRMLLFPGPEVPILALRIIRWFAQIGLDLCLLVFFCAGLEIRRNGCVRFVNALMQWSSIAS